jgi:hypothetical protein
VKLTYALVGLAALGGAVLSAGTASAMPIGLATNADIASNVEQGATGVRRLRPMFPHRSAVLWLWRSGRPLRLRRRIPPRLVPRPPLVSVWGASAPLFYRNVFFLGLPNRFEQVRSAAAWNQRSIRLLIDFDPHGRLA